MRCCASCLFWLAKVNCSKSRKYWHSLAASQPIPQVPFPFAVVNGHRYIYHFTILYKANVSSSEQSQNNRALSKFCLVVTLTSTANWLGIFVEASTEGE